MPVELPAAPLLIRGARVIDPASGLDTVSDVAIAEGRIADLGPRLSPSPAARVLDAEGCLLTPGLIDPHVHLREPGHEHKATILTGSQAAAQGGFTTVCCMPNTSPALDSPAALALVAARAASARCRVFPVAAATLNRHGEHLAPIATLAREGAVGFSDDGDAIASAGVMARVLRAVAAAGHVFMQHCEEPTLTIGASMHAGDVALRLGLLGWPREAETVIIERDLRLNRSAGCRYHVQHVSCAESVDVVRRARAEGQPATVEASPHHLLLTHEACDGFDTSAKMNPPLREARDIDALRAAVADGTITILATDHAPHAAHEKEQPFEVAPFGIVGLETALPLYREALIDSGAIDWPRLIALMTIEPARLCGLDGLGLGTLAIGGPADLTVIDPDAEWTIGRSVFGDRAANSPFLGRPCRSRTELTIAAGRVTHAGARFAEAHP